MLRITSLLSGSRLMMMVLVKTRWDFTEETLPIIWRTRESINRSVVSLFSTNSIIWHRHELQYYLKTISKVFQIYKIIFHRYLLTCSLEVIDLLIFQRNWSMYIQIKIFQKMIKSTIIHKYIFPGWQGSCCQHHSSGSAEADRRHCCTCGCWPHSSVQTCVPSWPCSSLQTPVHHWTTASATQDNQRSQVRWPSLSVDTIVQSLKFLR